MIAVIHSELDGDLIELLKKEIKSKFPSISFDLKKHQIEIIKSNKEDTILIVIDESLLNEGYINTITNVYENLECIICLVSDESLEDYRDKFGKNCMIIPKTKQGIQDEFRNIDGHSTDIADNKEQNLENILDIKVEGSEETDADDLLPFSFEEDEMPDLETSHSGHEETELDIDEEDLDIEIDSEVDFEDDMELLDIDLELEGELDGKRGVEADKEQIVPNDKIDVYETRIIKLRDYLNIPVWKKQKVKPKTIGIWSPLHRSGVTTLTINLGMFIADFNVPVAVLEGISQNIGLKSLLNLYSRQNKNWISYHTYLTDKESNPKDVMWSYNDVNFFPCTESDVLSHWDKEKIHYYINGLKFHDIVFVDIPTGEMESYTIDSLEHIDELWIVTNNDMLSISEWRTYIDNEIKPRVSVYLLFNEAYDFSKPKKIEDNLDIELLASVPAIHKEIAKNQYERFPLLEQENAYLKIEESFVSILEHVSETNINYERKEKTFLQKISGLWRR